MDKDQDRGPSQAQGKNQMMEEQQHELHQQPYTQGPQFMYQLQQHGFHQQQHELQQQLNTLWVNQYKEIQEKTNFKTHALPLARIKKVMKFDEDVHMISAEAPILFAKACELFIMELTTRAWANAEENKRRTLHKNDIASAISTTEVFDFLIDVVPRDDPLEQETFVGIPIIESSPIENVNPYYYYGPPHNVFGPSYYPAPGMVMARPVTENVAGPSCGEQDIPFAIPMCPSVTVVQPNYDLNLNDKQDEDEDTKNNIVHPVE